MSQQEGPSVWSEIRRRLRQKWDYLRMRLPRPRVAASREAVEALLPTAILVPTLARPGRIRELVANVHAATPEPHVLRFCTSDAETLGILEELGEWCLDDSDDPDKRYVTRMNKLVRCLDDERTIFFGSDDVRHEAGWLGEALAVMAGGPDVVVVNDLHNPEGTQAVVRREALEWLVFDEPGNAFHSGYRHNFCESEQYAAAARRGALARAYRSVVRHLHPAVLGRDALAWDETYERGQRDYAEDEARFRRRMARLAEASKAASSPSPERDPGNRD